MTDGSADELEDGWSAAAADDDTLVRRFVLGNAARVEWTAQQLDGRTIRRDDALLADFGSAVLFDNAVVLGSSPLRADLEAIVATARDLYAGRPWALMSALPLPDLSPFGLKLMGHPPSMLRPAGGGAPPPPPDLDIVEVADRAAMAVWNEVFAEGFPSPSGHVPLFDERVLGGPFRFWLGYVGERPVATSAAFVSHGVIDVEYVATLPDVRGRGFGEAITWPATLADPWLPATLIASDPGRPVYERMGYLSLLRFTLWYDDKEPSR